MKWTAALIVVLAVAACDKPPPRARTVDEFFEEPAVAQGVIARCDADKRASDRDPECVNARAAIERLATVEDSKRDPDRGAEFERQRAARRAHDEAARRAAEAANPPFDPYSSPVTVEPGQNPPAQNAPAAGAPKP